MQKLILFFIFECHSVKKMVIWMAGLALEALINSFNNLYMGWTWTCEPWCYDEKQGWGVVEWE